VRRIPAGFVAGDFVKNEASAGARFPAGRWKGNAPEALGRRLKLDGHFEAQVGDARDAQNVTQLAAVVAEILHFQTGAHGENAGADQQGAVIVHNHRPGFQCFLFLTQAKVQTNRDANHHALAAAALGGRRLLLPARG